jgi:hypothetical protein
LTVAPVPGDEKEIKIFPSNKKSLVPLCRFQPEFSPENGLFAISSYFHHFHLDFFR